MKTRSTIASAATRSARRKRDLGSWLIMLPGLLLFCFFVWEPLLESVRLSLYETQGIRTVRFVGLDNFRMVINHPDFWFAVRNTVSYTLWSLVIGFFMPMLLALAINEIVRGKSLFRVSMYLPNMIPGLATVFLWRYLFRSDASGGLNMLLSVLGIPPQSYLTDANRVIPYIVMTMTWKGAGATALIYLAGLQSISPELYEAAIIDGANCRQRLLNITVPQLFGLAKTLLILQVISVFQILYEPMVMTNGGPNNASVSLMQIVYRYAFQDFDYAKASALSLMIAAVLIALTLVYNRLNKPREV